MWASTSGAVLSFIGVAMAAGAMALTSTPVVAASFAQQELGQADDGGLGRRVDRQVRIPHRQWMRAKSL